jgi:hypothetical protein
MTNSLHKIGLYCTAVAGGFLTRALLEYVWEASTERPAPKNPDAKGVTWGEALLWGASAGVLVGVARTAARKGYTALTHTRPEASD